MASLPLDRLRRAFVDATEAFSPSSIAPISASSHNPAALNSRFLVERFSRRAWAELADGFDLTLLISHRVWKEPFHADFQ